ncbi:unnamed protein product [Periconia digitata]|uniref:Heterokaryon incompatibility domain-containing protein n=1 Tax=Periconia digitata TaxID=1303443 RepID=A0A9W4XLT3_9PLEO|nr:unnamed protein product [Periconia digitata]
MRLLTTNSGGSLCLKEFVGSKIPHYAILSHTWGPDEEEVTYQDLRSETRPVISGHSVPPGHYASKPGFKKLNFCVKQAAADGLQYSWVDTCCIDKSSSAELSEAINSMFQWYRDSTICYVYLADVHNRDIKSSRWFTRGWTLQELLAPARVEFFQADCSHLGNKITNFKTILQRKTRIPTGALDHSKSLLAFTVEERLSWAEGRQTKREEDMAYCLLGLFDVHMPLIYGEGRRKAFNRLMKEVRNMAEDAYLQSPYPRRPPSFPSPPAMLPYHEHAPSPYGPPPPSMNQAYPYYGPDYPSRRFATPKFYDLSSSSEESPSPPLRRSSSAAGRQSSPPLRRRGSVARVASPPLRRRTSFGKGPAGPTASSLSFRPPSPQMSSESNNTALSVSNNQELRLQFDVTQPLNITLKGDMDGRTLQFVPSGDGKAEIIIGGASTTRPTVPSTAGRSRRTGAQPASRPTQKKPTVMIESNSGRSRPSRDPHGSSKLEIGNGLKGVQLANRPPRLTQKTSTVMTENNPVMGSNTRSPPEIDIHGSPVLGTGEWIGRGPVFG